MLLQRPKDPVPVVVEQGKDKAPFLLVCEHAGLAVPAALGNLGLNDECWGQHIAIDLGAKQVARRLAEHLSSPLIFQQYSRLVIDCNRTDLASSLIPEISHRTKIPGNTDLGEKERAARIDEIHTPFHTAVTQELDRRKSGDIPTILVSIHSFTPVLGGEDRPWHIGIQYAKDKAFADLLLSILREDTALCVGDNLPWPVNELDDYTIPKHGDGRTLPYAMIEIRQDLIETEDAQAMWADRLARALDRARIKYYSDL